MTAAAYDPLVDVTAGALLLEACQLRDEGEIGAAVGRELEVSCLVLEEAYEASRALAAHLLSIEFDGSTAAWEWSSTTGRSEGDGYRELSIRVRFPEVVRS